MVRMLKILLLCVRLEVVSYFVKYKVKVVHMDLF
jgi:hypothetical protein